MWYKPKSEQYPLHDSGDNNYRITHEWVRYYNLYWIVDAFTIRELPKEAYKIDTTPPVFDPNDPFENM